MLVSLALLHLRARGCIPLVAIFGVAFPIEVLGLHREVFLPFSAGEVLRLGPVLPYAFALAAAPISNPRRFDLEQRGLRESTVRAVAIGFVCAGSFGLVSVATLGEPEEWAIAGRNYFFFFGLILLLSTNVEAKLAALTVGVFVVLYAYAGSQPDGTPREWAWLLQAPDSEPAALLSMLSSSVGLARDVLACPASGVE